MQGDGNDDIHSGIEPSGSKFAAVPRSHFKGLPPASVIFETVNEVSVTVAAHEKEKGRRIHYRKSPQNFRTTGLSTCVQNPVNGASMRQAVHTVRAPSGILSPQTGHSGGQKRSRRSFQIELISSKTLYRRREQAFPPLCISLFPHTRIYRSGRNASARSVPNRTRTPADTPEGSYWGSTSQKMKTRLYSP